MVDITEFPITGKMKEKLDSFISKNGLDLILGDFGKFEGADKCAVCGTRLVWSFYHYNLVESRHIGICCGSNIIALKQCNGDYSLLNFNRQLKLAKKTISKKVLECKQQQLVIELETKRDKEKKYCEDVLLLAQPILDDINKNNLNYDYLVGKQLYYINQCRSFLGYLKQGICNDKYLEKLHETMCMFITPTDLISSINSTIYESMNKSVERLEKEKLYELAFQKIRNVAYVCRLGKYDDEIVHSLIDWHDKTKRYSDKQLALIEKISHKYREQLKSKGEN